MRLFDPVARDYSVPAITAICAALIIKVALGLYTKRRGIAPSLAAIRFDVVTDFSVRDRADLARRVSERVAEEYPGYGIEVNVDYDLTD